VSTKGHAGLLVDGACLLLGVGSDEGGCEIMQLALGASKLPLNTAGDLRSHLEAFLKVSPAAQSAFELLSSKDF
jgi:hypothetical protein